MLRKSFARGAVALTAFITVGCVAGADAAPTSGECEARVNDTPAKLLECIQQAPLYAHLVALQKISDANPGPDGHGNRDTGQPGYEASVDYVAGLMRRAGYQVTVQPYRYTRFETIGSPTLAIDGRRLAPGADWRPARLSGSGKLAAGVRAVGALATAPGGSSSAGCSPGDFNGFPRGEIALIERGGCAADAKVAAAATAGASAVIFFNAPPLADPDNVKGSATRGGTADLFLETPATVPVIGYISHGAGAALYRQAAGGRPPMARLDLETRLDTSAIDYNVIADSRFGDPNKVVVLEGHLDAIYGAGILDNGSGSATILEIGRKLANTPTRNHLRLIWFGGEEIGLYGSKFYTRNLPAAEARRIAFDIDADVTATPNYAILIADPQRAGDVQKFPPNVVPQSHRGNQLFFDYFQKIGVPVRLGADGNGGTDSRSFSYIGVPNTGILTQQDCCKSAARAAIWGGFLGNYEGDIPSHDGGCVDRPRRWCDNLSNVAPYVHELVSKAVAYVTFELANDPHLPGRDR